MSERLRKLGTTSNQVRLLSQISPAPLLSSLEDRQEFASRIGFLVSLLRAYHYCSTNEGRFAVYGAIRELKESFHFLTHAYVISTERISFYEFQDYCEMIMKEINQDIDAQKIYTAQFWRLFILDFMMMYSKFTNQQEDNLKCL